MALAALFQFRALAADNCDVDSCPSARSAKHLETALLASDGVRLQLARALPTRSKGVQIRVGSQVVSAKLLQISVDETALIVLALDGQVLWFWRNGEAHVPFEIMGSLHGSAGHVTSFGTAQVNGNCVVALGHQNGTASIWHLQHEQQRKWQHMATLHVAHHDWESVDVVAVSSDARLLLACTADNALLWSLSQAGSESMEPTELRHLHGGAEQVAAAEIAMLSDEAYAVFTAFKSGTFEGWVVLDTEAAASGKVDSSAMVERRWQLSWHNRLIAVASGAMEEHEDDDAAVYLAAADAEGSVMMWQLDDQGSLLSNRPLWQAHPSSQGMPASSLMVVRAANGADERPAWRVVVGCGSQVVVFHIKTGKEVHRSTFSGSPLAFSWR